MNPEILAKITGIIAKGGERVIVVDAKTSLAVVLMSLDEYEKMQVSGTLSQSKPKAEPHLTQTIGVGMLDPDKALFREAQKTGAGDWGGDEVAEEDRYYMEPAE